VRGGPDGNAGLATAGAIGAGEDEAVAL